MCTFHNSIRVGSTSILFSPYLLSPRSHFLSPSRSLSHPLALTPSNSLSCVLSRITTPRTPTRTHTHSRPPIIFFHSLIFSPKYHHNTLSIQRSVYNWLRTQMRPAQELRMVLCSYWLLMEMGPIRIMYVALFFMKLKGQNTFQFETLCEHFLFKNVRPNNLWPPILEFNL
jgi:hypothetical protein